MPTQNHTFSPPKHASSQLTAHWSQRSFTFSAKERDVETGLSYFGSRYYSSDLSIWLSVDPQAAKYPGLSPYVYCANNPIKLVDPNGEEIVNNDDKWEFNTTTGELKWINGEGGTQHQTVVMVVGKNKKAFQQVDFDGPITEMFDPSVIGQKVDGAINASLDVINGGITAFTGAAVAVGSEGIASPIGYPIFAVGVAQFSIGVKNFANSLDGNNNLYQQHDMMVDICKSVANGLSGTIPGFKEHPVKNIGKALGGFAASFTWSKLQRSKATHPDYKGIPQKAKIKKLQ